LRSWRNGKSEQIQTSDSWLKLAWPLLLKPDSRVIPGEGEKISVMLHGRSSSA
jgi:hypothetical protein